MSSTQRSTRFRSPLSDFFKNITPRIKIQTFIFENVANKMVELSSCFPKPIFKKTPRTKITTTPTAETTISTPPVSETRPPILSPVLSFGVSLHESIANEILSLRASTVSPPGLATSRPTPTPTPRLSTLPDGAIALPDDPTFFPLYFLLSSISPEIDYLPITDLNVLIRRIGARLKLEGVPVFAGSTGTNRGLSSVDCEDQLDQVHEDTRAIVTGIVKEEVEAWSHQRNHLDARECMEYAEGEVVGVGTARVVKLGQGGGRARAREDVVTGMDYWI